MKVKDVLDHFISQAPWVNPSSTVDRVIVGDPEKEVTRCLVTWMPSLNAMREAVQRNIGFVVCHEPTFYNHRDDRPDAHPSDERTVAEKKEFIDRHELTVLRLHDTWDRWPEVGIPWAWARFLSVGSHPAAVASNGYQHRYDIEPVRLREFARRVAAKCAAIGEPMVQVTGDLGKTVSKIGIGTGCGCDLKAYREIGCDCSIVCDDGSCYWSGIQMAEDDGHPVIRVNHGTSEEPGMVTLAKYINEHLGGLKAEHLAHGATFRLLGG